MNPTILVCVLVTLTTYPVSTVAAHLRAIRLVVYVRAIAAIPKRTLCKIDQDAEAIPLRARAMLTAVAEGGV